MSREVVLQVKNLKKYFPIKGGLIVNKTVGQVKAVDDVSFEVYKGETVGVVGESGCGKSTMGKTVLRLIEPTSGEIIFEGKDLSKLSDSEMRAMRRSIQMIFQDPYASLNPRMTIGTTLEEPLILHKIGKDAVEREGLIKQILRIVGLNDQHYDYYPHEFSGGQRQRIAIARALISKPSLIIADEAVSALDVSVQSQILNLMKELQEEYKLTYIFISHNLSVIRFISDRIIVMYLGRVMEMAETDHLFNDAKHPYTQGLLDASPKLDRRRKRSNLILGMDIPSASNPPSGCVFHTRCPYAQEICSKEIPVLKKVCDDHFVACHFTDNLQKKEE